METNYIKSFGTLFSKKDIRDYKINKATILKTFPNEFELNMPEVKDQKDVESCVAHSIATVIEYFNRTQEGTYKEMSVGYIYGNRTNTTYIGKGMYVREAIAATCKYGDVTKELFPYNEEIPRIIDRFNSCNLFNEGEPNRFTSYYKVKTLDEIKTSLMKNGPVIIAMNWHNDIKVVDGIISTPHQQGLYGHCMVIYGWNECGWKIQNSWGTNWGNGGRAILPYNIKIREAWGVIDTITNTKPNVVKPYSTKVGNMIAKVLNIFINMSCSIIEFVKKCNTK